MYFATWKLVLTGLYLTAMLYAIVNCWKVIDSQEAEITELKRQIRQLKKGGNYEL